MQAGSHYHPSNRRMAREMVFPEGQSGDGTGATRQEPESQRNTAVATGCVQDLWPRDKLFQNLLTSTNIVSHLMVAVGQVRDS